MTDSTPNPKIPTFGIEKARELLKAAVETQGRDFIYNPQQRDADSSDPLSSFGCFNAPIPVGTLIRSAVKLGTPEVLAEEGDPRTKTGCIVGTALTLAGHTFHTTENRISDGAASTRFDAEGVEVYDWAAELYFLTAQGHQDQGFTWGEAYDFAESEAVEKGWLKGERG